MKNLFLFLILTLLFSCIDEVNLDLKENEKRLVIDANINWIIETDRTTIQKIKITKSANFYDKSVPFVNNAKVEIIDELEQVFSFKHTKEGIYECEDFIPFVGRKYKLYVEYQGEKYFAENTLLKMKKIIIYLDIRIKTKFNQVTKYYLTSFLTENKCLVFILP